MTNTVKRSGIEIVPGDVELLLVRGGADW